MRQLVSTIDSRAHLNVTGFSCFITNSSFIIQDSFQKTRKYILEKTSIILLAPLGPDAFEEATVDTAIYILSKQNKADNDIDVFVPDCPQNIISTKPYFIKQSRFSSNDGLVFDYLLKDIEFKIVSKLFRKFPVIEEGFEFGVGINTGYIKNELTASEKLDYRYHPMVPGSGISRYGTAESDGFIMYDKEYVKSKGELGRALPDEKFFQEPKILIVRTRNLSLKQRIVATIDVDKKYNLNRLSNIIARKGHNIYGLLGILNSRLYNWLYSTRYLDYEIKPTYLKKSPLADTNNSELVSKVKDILKIKAEQQTKDTHQFEKEIDQLVYKLYGLTEEEIAIVEGKDR